MIARWIIFFGLFCCQAVLGQTKENEIFLASKGTWKYPVPKHYKFESHCAPSYEFIADKGVSFTSDSSYPIKAIHDGEIAGVSTYDSVFMIVIKFGDYYLGYTELLKSIVKKGDQVKAGDLIGYMGKGLDGHFSLDIILNKQDENIDIYSWFKK